MSSSALEALARFPVTVLSDALDVLGVYGGCPGLGPIVPGARCVGPAYTVRFRPARNGESAPAADYIDDVPEGSVLVIDNAGRLDCTVWGSILTRCAVHKKIAGTVIHGCCRDSAEIAGLGYALFAQGAFMKSGKNRVKLDACNVPVDIAGTLVRAGDIVAADQDGVLVIPLERAADVARLALEVERMEGRVLADLRKGMRLAEARRLNGYDRFAFRASDLRQPPEA